MKKNSSESSKEKPAPSRDKGIVKTGIIGIIANFLLAGFKAVIGILTNSIAITLDAVNNLSDAGSSTITIVGTKLAAKRPDKKHPFGYGRIEYLSAMIISVIVLYAGISSLVESVKKIITPEEPDYSILAIVIISIAVVVKVVLGIYVRKNGEKYNSSSLVNSGKDALMDSVISLSTLIAAIIFMTTGFSLEAYLGAVISLFIIKSGIEMLREAISSILGEKADAELAKKIKATVSSFPGVEGAYDLVLHNYGPDSFNGSVHIEVPDTFSADDLDALLRDITTKVYLEHNVILTAIGVYSRNTTDAEAAEVRDKILKLVGETEHALQMHGFYLQREKKLIRFDVVASFDADRESLYREIYDKVAALYPDYTLQIVLDTDFTEDE